MSLSLNSRCEVAVYAAVAGFAVWALGPAEAQARVPDGPRLDSASAGCGQLQDTYDRAVRNLENASKHGTQAQYDAAFENLKSILRQWNGSPCARYFGSLIYRTSPAGGVSGARPTLAEPPAKRTASVGGAGVRGSKSFGATQSVVQRNRSAR